MLGPEPELGRDGLIPGNDPELGDLFFEFIGKLLDCREDCRREHDPAECDRDLRYDRDVEDPLRSAQCHLDDAAGFCDRDRFRERPVGAGVAENLFPFPLNNLGNLLSGLDYLVIPVPVFVRSQAFHESDFLQLLDGPAHR